MSNLVVFCVLWFISLFDATGQTVVPGHSHNDYLNSEPLHEALENGLISAEADVHLMKGELYVAHVRPLCRRRSRTLENLYLKPLFEYVQANDGRVYPDHDDPFYLMIDVKSAPGPSYRRLKELLVQYQDMLLVVSNDSVHSGPVHVFISGSRPIEEVLGDSTKLAGLDGRPGDIGKDISPTVMPVISDSYSNHFRWNGHGQMSKGERASLKELADRIHAEGKKLRLWASPDHPNAWQVLSELGVDLINTDKPEKFRNWIGSASD